MTRWWIALLALGLPVLLAACGPADPVRHGRDPAPGLTVFAVSQRPRLPRLSGPTLSGQELTASSYAGASPLVINVWASWCSPCRRELPLLARAARHGVRVLGIDERDDASRARSFVLGRQVPYPSLSDPDGRVLAALRLLPQQGIPSTLVVNGSGRVVARVVGPLDPESLTRAIAKVTS